MQDPRSLKAFRLSGSLNLQIHRITERLPADTDPRWIEGLRSAASALAQRVLRGCAGRGLAAELALRDAMDDLDRVGEGVERGEELGILGPDAVLELLELQTALLMQLILITQGVGVPPTEKAVEKTGATLPGRKAA